MNNTLEISTYREFIVAHMNIPEQKIFNKMTNSSGISFNIDKVSISKEALDIIRNQKKTTQLSHGSLILKNNKITVTEFTSAIKLIHIDDEILSVKSDWSLLEEVAIMDNSNTALEAKNYIDFIYESVEKHRKPQTA